MNSPDEGNLFYKRAFIACAIFQLIHIAALPIFVTFDGSLYIQLSDTLFSPNFIKDWDFLRVPLFPFLIKVFSILFGQHPLSMILLNSLLGFCGSWMLASAVKREGFPRLGAATLLILSLYPILITYQHTLLSDVGIFCCLAGLMNVSLMPVANLKKKTLFMTAAIGISYYFRPNLLFLGPIMALFYFLQVCRGGQGGNWLAILKRCSRPALLHSAIVLIVPFILAQPWKYLARLQDPEAIQKRMDEQLFFGMFNQMVIHPNDPLLNPDFSARYQALINSSLVNGHLPLDGIGGGIINLAFEQMPNYSKNTSFLKQVIEHPMRYAKGAGRTFLLFCGFQGHNWPENRPFLGAVLPKDDFAEATILMCPPTLDATMRAHFSQKTGKSVVSTFLRGLNLVYDYLVILGAFVTLSGLAVAIFRSDVQLFVYTGLPFAFIMMHALALLAGDRYAFPGFSVMLMNLVVCPVLIFAKKQQPAEFKAS